MSRVVEAPSLYKKPKGAEDQTQSAPVVTKQKQSRPKTSEGRAQKPRANRSVSGAAAARTLYIGKVYIDELDQDPKRSQQLNQERLKLLKEVFQRFGDVERFEPHTEDAFVHVAYKDRKNAEDAIAQLSQRSVRDEIMDQLKEQLKKSKLPETVCPVLWKYRYEWSNKSAESPSTVEQPRPKTAVAKKVESPTVAVPNGTVAPADKKKKKKEKKAPAEPAKPSDIVIEKKPRVITTQDLQLEAERARLTQDLEYLRTQHTSVKKELNAERERCSSRDERIKRLEEEHGRVRQHSLTLENQLKTDMTWKQAADERIMKLREEIDHIQQQQLLVQTMLKNAI